MQTVRFCWRTLFFSCFLLVGLSQLAYGVLHDLARSVKVLQIKSLSQSVVKNNTVVLKGEVEVVVDNKLRIWAERVFVDKKKQILIAHSVNGASVVVEDENFLILADRFVFNFADKTGFAQNLRLHVEEGYLSARRAEKLASGDWQLTDMMYTACDHAPPHWSINAHRAVVRGGGLVRASGIICKAGGVPLFWLPRFMFPIQGRSKSGFLIPRFAFDYDYGFGYKQEYYKYFTPHCDMTLGVDWRDRKGIVFSDEFRLARAPEQYTQVNTQYAILRDRFIEKNDKIVKATMRRYWINGKDFRFFPQSIGSADVSTLVRLDFGTDKRIGYHFFNSTDAVDDTFNNSVLARLYWPNQQVWVQGDSARTNRKHSYEFSRQAYVAAYGKEPAITNKNGFFAITENEDHVTLSQAPHVEWNTAFQSILKKLHYRQDLFFDQALYRQKEIERVYVNSLLVDEKRVLPLNKIDFLRFNYRSKILYSLPVAHNIFTASFSPSVQLVSNIAEQYHAKSNVLEGDALGNGAYRVFGEYGLEWAMPEGTTYTSDMRYRYTMQPVLSWEMVPKFYQQHWYYFDKWDRAYPKNQVAASLRNEWDIDAVLCYLDLKQAYDFYSSKDIFPLRAGVGNNHMLPFRYDLGFNHENFAVGVGQEIDWPSFELLQSELTTELMVKRVKVGIGYLFQKRKMQERRGLLADIPHFIVSWFSVPLGNNMMLSYDAQFYAPLRSSFFFLDGIKPLIHRIRLDYDGHCWGFNIGFEEKKYKEYGIGRNERAIVFTLRLDSLGSFAKKFRRIPHSMQLSQ